MEKNGALALEYGEALLERVADKEEWERERVAYPERFETTVPRLMTCKGKAGKMTLVELAFGLETTKMFCDAEGRLLSFNGLATVLGKIFGESLANASQLKQDLLRWEDPGALFRQVVDNIDEVMDERFRYKAK